MEVMMLYYALGLTLLLNKSKQPKTALLHGLIISAVILGITLLLFPVSTSLHTLNLDRFLFLGIVSTVLVVSLIAQKFAKQADILNAFILTTGTVLFLLMEPATFMATLLRTIMACISITLLLVLMTSIDRNLTNIPQAWQGIPIRMIILGVIMLIMTHLPAPAHLSAVFG
ncbi:hypothetical protein H6504_02725 [Candidatus Woesearchaeota archaeon]|nr:hypothetical protein [Candidatus Woesearchaeota archaeon]